MYDFFKTILSDDFGGPEITLFSIWHILYIVVIVGLTIAAAFILRNKSERTKKIVVNTLLIAVLVAQFLDLFAMPFSDGYINIDKLPFHICTSISIIAGFAYFNQHFAWLKTPAIVLSIVAPLMYITYPGSALGGVAAFCYRVVQTFFFHGALFAFGVLAIATKQVSIDIKKIWKELLLIIGIACWAGLGNAIYCSPAHHYDWFFLTGSTFPFVPTWLMPFVVVICVYAMVAIIYGIVYLVRWIDSKIKSKQQQL